jgi:hypothetical protein
MPKNKNVTLVINYDGAVNLCAQMEDGEHIIPTTAKAVELFGR